MEASCKATGTYFCAMFTMHERGQAPRSHPLGDQKLRDDQLLKAYIEIVIDQTAVKREIDGMKKFVDLTHDTENLALVRMAIMSTPSRMTHTTSDLTAENPVVWKAWKKYLGKELKFPYSHCWRRRATRSLGSAVSHGSGDLPVCV